MFTLEQYKRKYLFEQDVKVENRDSVVGFVLNNVKTNQELFIPHYKLNEYTLGELSNALGISSAENISQEKIIPEPVDPILNGWTELDIYPYQFLDSTGNTISVDDELVTVNYCTQCYAAQLGLDSVVLDDSCAYYFLFEVNQNVIDKFIYDHRHYSSLRGSVTSGDFIRLLQREFITHSFCIQKETDCTKGFSQSDIKLFKGIVSTQRDKTFLCMKLYQDQVYIINFVKYNEISTFISSNIDDVASTRIIRAYALFYALNVDLAKATLCSNLIDMDFLFNGKLNYANYIMPYDLPKEYNLEQFYQTSYGRTMYTDSILTIVEE